MNIDLLHNNHAYYDGFEREEEIEIVLANDPSLNIHFWVGYIDDILQKPDLTGNGWTGFTRDYHQLERVFSNDPDPDYRYDPQEYLLDIMQYKDAAFNNEESFHVLRLIVQLLEYAISTGSQIFIRAH